MGKTQLFHRRAEAQVSERYGTSTRYYSFRTKTLVVQRCCNPLHLQLDGGHNAPSLQPGDVLGIPTWQCPGLYQATCHGQGFPQVSHDPFTVSCFTHYLTFIAAKRNSSNLRSLYFASVTHLSLVCNICFAQNMGLIAFICQTVLKSYVAQATATFATTFNAA
jgi:hypothetical protein